MRQAARHRMAVVMLLAVLLLVKPGVSASCMQLQPSEAVTWSLAVLPAQGGSLLPAMAAALKASLAWSSVSNTAW